MRRIVKKICEAVLESPSWKTFFSVVIPILSGLFCGVFVIEITTENGVDWRIFYKSKSFYALVLLTIVVYLYNKAVYTYERDMSKFLDKDYCIAYMRSKCLPEAAERYKQKIRNGEGGELKEAMEEVEKILK